MTRFRQALLDELLTRVADPAVPTAPASRTPRRRRPRLVFAASALAAVAAAVALVATQRPTTPAYAMTTNPDGTVTVTFNHIADPDGVNRALREAGLPAIVLLPQPADSCPVEDRGSPIPVGLYQAWSIQQALVTHGQDKANVARLRPDQIPAGTVLVLVPMDRGPRGEAGPYLRIGHYQEPGPRCAIADW